ncbi:hypothetical protein [Eoetvoesiella caeni]
MKDKNDDKTCELALVVLEAKKTPGRPKIYSDNAARQAAYRARKRSNGFREVSRFVLDVRDINKPLKSSTIDLSEVRRSRLRRSS